MQTAPIHVCCALSTDGEPHYRDLLAVSAKAVRRLYPDARLTIVSDVERHRNKWG